MEVAPGIIVDKNIKFGKPVIKGSRVPVELILGKLAAGVAEDEICREYLVNPEDILAALNYAAGLVAEVQYRAIG